ncbi:MAG: hypothetical protein ACLTXW_15180 [Christensenellales bacterium]
MQIMPQSGGGGQALSLFISHSHVAEIMCGFRPLHGAAQGKYIGTVNT